MTTTLDAEMGPEITAAIAEVGVTMTFQARALTPNPSTGAVTETLTPHDRLATPPTRVNRRFEGSDSVKEDDRFVILDGAGIPFAPALDMRVDFQGVSHRVVGIIEYRTGDLIGAYGLALRR